MRMRQTLLVAEFLEHAHHRVSVFIHVVIDRAGVTRVGAIVIHAQTTAHVDMINRQAQRAQLAKVADGFAEAMLVISEVGNLRPHVKVQQPHSVLQARLAEAIDHAQQLRRRQPKLGFFPSRIGPLARSQR